MPWAGRSWREGCMPFCHRELNGEMRWDWTPDYSGPVFNADYLPVQPETYLGGPFQHRFVSGVCTVCGYQERYGLVGCPARVDMKLLPPSEPLTGAVAFRQAAKAIREIWAADKAAKEEARG